MLSYLFDLSTKESLAVKFRDRAVLFLQIGDRAEEFPVGFGRLVGGGDNQKRGDDGNDGHPKPTKVKERSEHSK